MGLLSAFTSGLGSLISGPIGSIIGNPGSSSGYGTNGLIGTAINDITGQSQSARQQYQYNLALQKNAQQFAKWQMGNSHQQEVADLEKAGLNPVLSAGGNGASASVGGGTTGAGVSGVSPFEIASGIMQMINSAKTTDATVKKVQSDIKNETKLTDAEVGKIDAETDLAHQNYDINIPDETIAKGNTKIEENLSKWFVGRELIGMRNLTRWALNSLGLTGAQAMNTAATAYGAHKLSKAYNKPKTTVTNMYNGRGKLTGSRTSTSR